MIEMTRHPILLALPLALLLLVPVAARERGPERSTISEIIIHATGGPSCRGGRVVFSDPGTIERMRLFFARSATLGIHYIIERDGRIARGVPENQVAVHTMDNNEASIGIELINRGDGSEPFPEPQVRALATLVVDIMRRRGLGLEALKRHSDIDHSTFTCAGRLVRRKQDPGPVFPWDSFLLSVLIETAAAPSQTAASARRR
jgi:N-acetyl-anhydromuramyl-L-alanine amidase AmpD